MAEVALKKLAAYLDEYLRVSEVPDYSGAHNGLQLEGREKIAKVAAAVDASRATIEKAVELEADLLIVHHGLFWSGVQKFTGPVFKKLRPAFEHGLAIYSSHLPLDAHVEVGNNHELARALGLSITGPFGTYEDFPIGLECSADLPRSELMQRLDTVLDSPSNLLECGPLRVRRIGVVTGGGGSLVEEAGRTGLDTLITGEGAHHTFLSAEDYGVNVFYSGHYATETFGVRALAQHLNEKFDLSWEFIDHPSGL